MSAGFWEHPLTVRVPATSANLGPGFDALGLALGLFDEITVSVASAGLSIDVEGEGADTVARDESHLVVRSMRRAYDAMDISTPGLLVSCLNRIPHARGLGSSSAAIVGGLWAARASVVDGDERLSNDDLLQLATAIEGHPDNVAPCLLGGFTIAWSDPHNGHTKAVSRTVVRDVSALAFIPSDGVATEAARGLLPESVPHADAVFNLARSALLVDALVVDDARSPIERSALLMDATDDRLHQQQRASVMPNSSALVNELRHEGVPAMISGAGPTVLALIVDDDQHDSANGVAARTEFRVEPMALGLGGAVVVAG